MGFVDQRSDLECLRMAQDELTGSRVSAQWLRLARKDGKKGWRTVVMRCLEGERRNVRYTRTIVNGEGERLSFVTLK